MATKKEVKTSTTKTPEKKIVKRTSATKSTTPQIKENVSVEKKDTQVMSPRVRKSYIIGGLALVLLIAVLFAFRSVFVAAMVNGQPVTRLSLVRELEKQNGKQALEALVTKTLIFQEARKQNVTVSEADVDTELKKIEKNLSSQGQKLDQVLSLQGMTKESLIEQIKIQKMIEKMVGKDIKISDKEVDQYIADNQESFPEGSDEAQIKTQVKEQIQQQKLNEKVQTWLEKLQKDASINYFINL